MQEFKTFKVLSIAFLLISFLGIGEKLFSADDTKVKITVPEREGMQVGKGIVVKGTASIPGGKYLWVLAHNAEEFEGLWWPQNEAKIDPKTNTWHAYVVFGEPQDVGSVFGIAAIVVDEKEHAKLRNYRENAMRTGVWNPISIPPTIVAPEFRTVKKVSHN